MSRKFQCRAIPSTWLEHNGRRLDCGPYLSGAVEAKELVSKLVTNKLAELTGGPFGGIFKAPRLSPNYVGNKDYGIPYLSSTDILKSDLSSVSLISKNQAKGLEDYFVRHGMTLVTSSGETGRTSYARSDMDGMMGSPHFMRIKPDTTNVLPGYLFAYLSSTFGKRLMTSGTYGSIIQAIEPHHIVDLPVPRLGKVEYTSHELVQSAANNRVLASNLEDEAIMKIYSTLRMSIPSTTAKPHGPSLTILSSPHLLQRMDSYYYSEENIEAREAFDKAGNEHGRAILGDVADVWIPNIFKREYVSDPDYGCPYFTGQDIYELAPSTNLYLKRDIALNNRLTLSTGMILIQDSGQVSGLIGRPVLVSKYLNGTACTNNMVRLVLPDQDDNGYLFALLSTHHGIRLLKREASGSSIPHLEEKRIKRLVIPWPDQGIRKMVGEKVIRALELRDTAIDMENEARSLVERVIEEGAS